MTNNDQPMLIRQHAEIDLELLKEVRRVLADMRANGVRKAEYGLATPYEHSIRLKPAIRELTDQA